MKTFGGLDDLLPSLILPNMLLLVLDKGNRP